MRLNGGNPILSQLTPAQRAMLEIGRHEWTHAHHALSTAATVNSIQSPTAFRFTTEAERKTCPGVIYELNRPGQVSTTLTANPTPQDISAKLLTTAITALMGPAHDRVVKRFETTGTGFPDYLPHASQPVTLPLKGNLADTDYLTAAQSVSQALQLMTGQPPAELQEATAFHLCRAGQVATQLAKTIPQGFSIQLSHQLLADHGGVLTDPDAIKAFHQRVVQDHPQATHNMAVLNKGTVGFIQRTKELVRRQFS
jgi:hypothetical protein